MAGKPAESVESLYIHVPFCARKCLYCAFYSEPAGAEIVDRYVGALIRELEWIAPDLRPQTVFFGGGTPSLLSIAQWKRVLADMERLGLLGAPEWTIECNPATVSPDKARLWLDFGVNRISLGVQSLQDDLLARLGRIHTREKVFQTYDLLRRVGYDNVNLDLMFAIPGQSLTHWRETLDEALAMESEHLSSYEVTYEEDTPLFAQLQAGEFNVNEDLACDMYEALCDRSAERGFVQYEVSNFAKDAQPPSRSPAGAPEHLERAERGRPVSPVRSAVPREACRHNVNYWRGGTYYGLGPSAASFVRGVRTTNWADTSRYCEALEQGLRPTQSADELTPLRRAGEIAAFGLRMTAGWPFAGFQQVTGFDLRIEWAREMSLLVDRGWAVLMADTFRLTPLGLRFADGAAELFLR